MMKHHEAYSFLYRLLTKFSNRYEHISQSDDRMTVYVKMSYESKKKGTSLISVAIFTFKEYLPDIINTIKMHLILKGESENQIKIESTSPHDCIVRI